MLNSAKDAATHGSVHGPAHESLNAAIPKTLKRSYFCLTVALLIAIPAWPQQQPKDLAEKSMEDLMNMEVTSVSKKEQKLSRTAAAIFVITQEDIRRSGATNIPDLLRMVPGLDVGQIDSNTWAISARGFNEEFSTKLLMMVDGQGVYTPTFAGVFWDTLDLPLDDIERIEVIRGPGGTGWGSNAVNGVINVITKKVSETTGGQLIAGGGNLDEGFATLQYGGPLGKATNYRVYAKYFDQAGLPNLNGQPGGDGWHMLRGSFRVDGSPSSKDNITAQGDLYGGREGEVIRTFGSGAAIQDQAALGGGYIQTVWNHAYSTGSNTTLQISYDRYIRNLSFRDKRSTLNLDFQHNFAWGVRQEIAWGIDYRFTDHLSNTAAVSFDPSDNIRQLFSSFVQDEIALAPNRLYLTAGIRLEHNNYTGLVAMPNVRLAWIASPHDTLWAAVSGATRTPSSADTSAHVTSESPGGVALRIVLNGNPNFENERLLAYEAGYRASVLHTLTIDFSAYYNSYHSLRTVEPQTPFLQTNPLPPVLIVPLEFRNEMYGEAHGLEISANWKVTSRWTLNPGYAFERLHMHLDPTSQDTLLFPLAQGGSPDHSAQVRSHLDLTHGWSWDASAYFVDRLQALSTPSYTRVDTGLAWSLTERTSLSVVGQNLVKDHRLEYLDKSVQVQSGLLKRGVYAKFTWQF